MFGSVDVTYVNPLKKSTYLKGVSAKKMEIFWKDGKKQTVEGKKLSGRDALRLRNVEAKAVKVYF